jgi:transcriptional regulator with XRE-family HTH domain
MLSKLRMDVFTLLGSNLYAVRRAKGLSQEAVGARMGVDRAHVSLIERGKQNLTLATLQQLCFALEVSPAALFDPNVAPRPERPAPAARPPRQTIKPPKRKA